MFARTERLTLRPGWPEDAPVLAQAVVHDAPWPAMIDDPEAFLRQARAAHDPAFLIFDQIDSGPRLVGGVAVESGELGLWITPPARNSGYATEAGRAVIAMARHALGYRRLTARHLDSDPGSARVLTKLGFRPAGPSMIAARNGHASATAYIADLHEQPAMPIAA